MLKIKQYTKEELFDLVNTKDLSNAKRTLTRLGYEFITEGRGDNYRLTITATPTPFKMFCIEELGFNPNTDFEKLKTFLYVCFCDETARELPFSALERMFAEERTPIERHTLSFWMKHLRKLGLLHIDKTEAIYFVSFSIDSKVYTEEITKEKYVEAWASYWKAINEGEYEDGLAAMRKVAGGKVFKKYKIVENGIYADVINRLVEILEAEI